MRHQTLTVEQARRARWWMTYWYLTSARGQWRAYFPRKDMILS